MVAELRWDDTQHSIVLCQFANEFDVDTYAVLEGQLPTMLGEVPHRVDLIAYLAPGASLPNVRGILPEIAVLMNVLPPNLGLLVGVGNGWLLTNPVSIVLASAFLKLYYPESINERVYVTRTVEEARARILRHRIKSSFSQY